MNELFKALKNFKPRQPDDNFYIELIDKEIISLCREEKSNTIKISQQDYKFLLDNGIEYFIYDNEIVKKPKKKTERLFKILKKDTQGYKLYKGNPYWPEEMQEGGYTWQTPSE